MATRFSVSLAHSGCDHTGFVVWEERADACGASGPSVVGLPRGFVSLNSEDGAIEVVCAGCRQTVASAARVDVPASDPAAGEVTAREPTAEEVTAGGAAATAAAAPRDGAVPRTAASADHEAGEAAGAPADATAEDKVRADIEALFAEAKDVAPIRGDAIPPHLLDKLRHLADRMRQRRE